MNEDFLDTEVLTNSVRLKALGQLCVLLGQGLIGLSSILADCEEHSRNRDNDDDHYLSNRY